MLKVSAGAVEHLEKGLNAALHFRTELIYILKPLFPLCENIHRILNPGVDDITVDLESVESLGLLVDIAKLGLQDVIASHEVQDPHDKGYRECDRKARRYCYSIAIWGWFRSTWSTRWFPGTGG